MEGAGGVDESGNELKVESELMLGKEKEKKNLTAIRIHHYDLMKLWQEV